MNRRTFLALLPASLAAPLPVPESGRWIIHHPNYGKATTFDPLDHKHLIGVAEQLARADHVHALYALPARHALTVTNLELVATRLRIDTSYDDRGFLGLT